MPLDPIILQRVCPSCGCGEVSCAHYAVTCMCCGNASFIQGTNVSDRFDSGALSCPVCGKTWQGVWNTDPSCDSPTLGNNTLTHFGESLYYRYQATSDGLFHLAEFLELAQMSGVSGTITDSCGHTISQERVFQES